MFKNTKFDRKIDVLKRGRQFVIVHDRTTGENVDIRRLQNKLEGLKKLLDREENGMYKKKLCVETRITRKSAKYT